MHPASEKVRAPNRHVGRRADVVKTEHSCLITTEEGIDAGFWRRCSKAMGLIAGCLKAEGREGRGA
jgi:hypothetical protein